MRSYDQARNQRLTAETTRKLMGVPVDVPADLALRIGGADPLPLQWCECSTDPCDCDGPIIWLPEEAIRERVPTDRRTRDGEQLYEFRVDLNATIAVELTIRTRAGDLGNARGRLPSEPPRLTHRLSTDHCGCKGPTTRIDSSGVYAGTTCAGGVQYEMYVDSDGLSTTVHYVAIGSC